MPRKGIVKPLAGSTAAASRVSAFAFSRDFSVDCILVDYCTLYGYSALLYSAESSGASQSSFGVEPHGNAF